ncbi:MAG: oxidoreductase [Chitinophagales bacterium]|nr:oxidoreductase [Chitinophagales bacterium]
MIPSFKALIPLLFFLPFLNHYDNYSKKQPEVKILTSGTKTSIRGLSVVNDNVVWVSGSNGTIGRSIDGGKNWVWMKVSGFERSDFRDIEAFDGATAVIMAVDSPAYILKTINGGKTWKVVYENKTKGMFLDAMEFWNDLSGIVIGDPIDGRFFIARTFDGGDSWKEIPYDKRPEAEKGEACFAASGTNVRPLDRDEAVFVSGGTRSRIFSKNGSSDLPLLQGKETTGANSIAVWDNKKMNGGKRMIVAGGDFNDATSTERNCFYTNDGGKTWIAPETPPHGYRSCVEYYSKNVVISCGLNGVDYSTDGGKNWDWISKQSFNVCRTSKLGLAFYFAGNNGTIGKLVMK